MKYRLPYIAITGRVKTFLNGSPTLPVSCTTYVVKDYQGYLESLKFTSYALRHGAGVSLHIGELDLSGFPTSHPKVYFYLHKDHLDYEEFSRLPNVVSEPVGQVLKVYDSMVESIPGTVSIEDSWIAVHNFSSDDVYTIDLSLLRPKGKANDRGLVASGAASFALILLDILNVLSASNKLVPIMRLYSRLNEVLRRGGIYKNGAVVIHCDIDSPLCLDFLSATRADCPWARMSLNLNKDCNPQDILQRAIPLVRSGDLFLVKKVYDADGHRIYHNVCLEVLLPHRGTCLLSHVNLGSTPKGKIVKAFERGMKFLCLLHSRTGVDKDGVYLSSSKDRQVGLGVIGLANLLAFYQVKYKDFVHALKGVLDGVTEHTEAYHIADRIVAGYTTAARIAMSHNMDRAFCIAPTANTSFQYKDMRRYTTTPEISPPIARTVSRVSETCQQIDVKYPPDCETAAEVGWDVYFDLLCQWQRLMDITGLAHSISANWWSDCVVMNESFIDQWLKSNLLSLYYALPVLGDVVEPPVCSSCAE